MRKLVVAMCLLFLTALTILGMASADEKQIPVGKLPAAVSKAALAKFPKAKIVEAGTEDEDGELIYEVVLKDDDQEISLGVKADGTIFEIERAITRQQLPSAVKKAIEKGYAKGRIVKAESIVKGDEGELYYEVVVASELVFSADGKLLEVDEDEDERQDQGDRDDKDGEDKNER